MRVTQRRSASPCFEALPWPSMADGCRQPPSPTYLTVARGLGAGGPQPGLRVWDLGQQRCQLSRGMDYGLSARHFAPTGVASPPPPLPASRLTGSTH